MGGSLAELTRIRTEETNVGLKRKEMVSFVELGNEGRWDSCVKCKRYRLMCRSRKQGN